MFRECTHILASGLKCKAPAVTGGSLCRHHRPRKQLIKTTPFRLPEINDPRGILRAISEVLNALNRRRIRRSEAGTFLFGLRLAARSMSNSGSLTDAFAPQSEYCEPEFSFDHRATEPLPERSTGVSPTTFEDARQFLAAIQSASGEKALNKWRTAPSAK